MKIHFAPLQGYTDNAYRRLHHRVYGSVDCYYTPFVRIEKGEPRRQDMARLQAAKGDECPVVPQIIFNSEQEFSTLVEAIKGVGYTRIDLNLGCPYPMQTRKGRGAALIANTDLMTNIAELINRDKDCRYSVKMRLGLKDSDEWRMIMPILNSMQLEHVTLHPRVAMQMYGNELYRDSLMQFLSESANPVVYNGDVDLDFLHQQKLPDNCAGVMIGRGLLARPSLAAEWREGKEWSEQTRLQRLMQFHDALFEEYRTSLCGEAQILQKIKPFWDYLEEVVGRKTCKLLRKATSVNKYLGALPNY